ncbi:hypothetical protein BHE74_00005981 [Ensete ventricosum]|nr:hypothetical protein BHE74_00005981 [Ensete ventricosum]
MVYVSSKLIIHGLKFKYYLITVVFCRVWKHIIKKLVEQGEMESLQIVVSSHISTRTLFCLNIKLCLSNLQICYEHNNLPSQKISGVLWGGIQSWRVSFV